MHRIAGAGMAAPLLVLSTAATVFAGPTPLKLSASCNRLASTATGGCFTNFEGSEMVVAKIYGAPLRRRLSNVASTRDFPGIGYAVGVPARMIPILVDVDRAPISATSTSPGFGVLPHGCSKTSLTVINCNLPNGGTVSGVNTAPNTKHGAVSIIFNGAPSGNIIIKYCNLEADAGTSVGKNAKGLIYIDNGSTANVTLYANTLDGHADKNSGFNGQTATINTSGRIVVKYNAFKNAGGRVLNGVINAKGVANPGDEDFENNLFIGMGYFSGGAHAEIWEGVLSAPSNFHVTIGNVIYRNNTCIQPEDVAKSQTTSCIYASTGHIEQAKGFGVTINNVIVDHNLIILQKNNGSKTTSAAVEFAYDFYNHVRVTNNVIVGPGAYYAFLCTGAPYVGGVYQERAYAFRDRPIIQGNVDISSGDQYGINRIGASANGRFDQFSTYRCNIP